MSTESSTLLLDLPTLLVTATWLAALLGLFLFVAWVCDRGIPALAWWSSAYIIGGSAVALWSAGDGGPISLGPEIPSALLMLALGMIWTGTRLFHGRPVRPIALLAGAAVWLVATGPLGADAAVRLAVAATTIATYAFLTATEVWSERRVNSHPRWLAVAVPLLHASVFVFPVIMPALSAKIAGVASTSDSMVTLTLATLLYAVGTAFLILGLVQDRSIRIHKIAATTDVLTGLYNRRAFLEGAQHLIDGCAAKRQPVTVLMFDLDHFKKINDTFGHAIGDEALKLFARTASGCMRANDIIGRLGGEEFAAVVPGDGGVANNIAERIRTAFQAAGVTVDGHQLNATVSIGAAWTINVVACERLIEAADGALYRAKEKGRNRLELAPVPVRATASPGNLAAAAVGNGNDRRSGGHAGLEVGPTGGRILEACRVAAAAFARVLYGNEKSFIIGCEDWPAQLGARGHPVKMARRPAQ